MQWHNNPDNNDNVFTKAKLAASRTIKVMKDKPWHKDDRLFDEYVAHNVDHKEFEQVHVRLPDPVKKILKRIRYVTNKSYNCIINDILDEEFRKHKYDTYRKNLF